MLAHTGRVGNSPGFVAPVTAFIEQPTTSATDEELNLKPKMTKGIPSLPNTSFSASASSNSGKDSEVRRSRPKGHV